MLVKTLARCGISLNSKFGRSALPQQRKNNRAMFDLAIDSKLRGRNLVKLKIDDLLAGTDFRTRALVV
jgi:hypothetical protein